MNHSAAYDSLVGLLADQGLECEWRAALEIPLLSAEDAEVVAAEYPDEVEERTFEVFRLVAVRPYLLEKDFLLVGAKCATAMREAARDVIWLDVQTKIEELRDEEADEYAQAHPESADSLHGVAGLFRG